MTTTENTASLKNVLISEVAGLNGMIISKKNFVKRIVKKYSRFSPAYVEMYVNKCIINNPRRSKWGQGVDLFAENKGFLVSNEKYITDFEYIKEDVEYVKARKQTRKVEMAKIIENYMKGATFAI